MTLLGFEGESLRRFKRIERPYGSFS